MATNTKWYCDSSLWTAVTAWAASVTPAVGVLRRQNAAPTVGNERVFVCIVSGLTGATEPTWTVTKGAKTTDNLATWQEVTGIPALNADATNTPTWTLGPKGVAVALGEVIKDDAGTTYLICTTAGTAGSGAEPTWNTTAGATTADNTVTWTSLGAISGFTTVWGAPLNRIKDATAWMAAGDRLYVGNAHGGLGANNTSYTCAFPGTLAAPNQILCVVNTAAPPTTAASSAVESSQGTGQIGFQGVFKLCGVTIKNGSGASSGNNLTICSTDLSVNGFSDSQLWLGNTTAIKIVVGSTVSGNETACTWTNVSVKFAAAAHTITLGHCKFAWDGGGLVAGTTSPTNLINISADFGSYLLRNLDLSAGAAAMNIFNSGAGVGVGVAKIIDSVLPASWTGSLGATPTNMNQRLEMHNCDSADTNYRLWLRDYTGDVTSDDALYRAPGLGASSWMYNGTTQVVGISHKFATTANARYPLLGLVGQELAGLNTTIDPTTSHVVTCYFTTPGQADFTPLSNKDIGLTVQYPGTAGSPLGKSANDLVANVLTAEADQDADTTGDWDDALGAWAASTAYSVGAVVRPTTRNGKTYYCSVAGTSHTVEPTWLTTEGGETSEGGGTAKWRCMHRQKMVVTLDATAGKVRERGWLHLTPVMYLASAVAWVDPQASVTSS